MSKLILNVIAWLWLASAIFLLVYTLSVYSADIGKSTPAGIGVYPTARVEMITGIYLLFLIAPYLLKYCINKFNVPEFSQIPFRMVYSVFPKKRSSILFALLFLFFGLVGIIRGLKGL
jgi:hypothetical protein